MIPHVSHRIGRAITIAFLVLAASLVTPLASASDGQDDAGSGRDAPNVREDALPVPFGRVEGAFSHATGDTVDWYRVDVPEGHALRVRLEKPSIHDIRIYVYDANGNLVDGQLSYSSWSTVAAPTRDMFLGVHTFGGDGPYAMDVEPVRAADLAITDIAVSEPPATGPAGTRDEWAPRTVTVTVENRGPMSVERASLIIREDHMSRPGDPPWHFFASWGGPLDVGESRVIELSWDPHGDVGHVHLRASVSSMLPDPHWRNGRATAHAEVLVAPPFIGVGADLTHHHAQTIAGRASATVDRAGADVDADSRVGGLTAKVREDAAGAYIGTIATGAGVAADAASGTVRVWLPLSGVFVTVDPDAPSAAAYAGVQPWWSTRVGGMVGADDAGARACAGARGWPLIDVIRCVST